jgi:aspartate carbamoyltransferase regulatory subunit
MTNKKQLFKSFHIESYAIPILKPSRSYISSNKILLAICIYQSGEICFMTGKDLRVSKIKNGTVIDHISAGYALDVVKILGITGHERRIITIAINIPSKDFKVKDIVKIEGRALNSREVNRIALVAPHASINIIRDYSVLKKVEVKLPKIIEGIIKCINPACVSNSNEPVNTKFYVKNDEPLLLKCHYCGYVLEKSDVLDNFS